MTSEGHYAGTQPAEATSGEPTSSGFPPDADDRRPAGRATAQPPVDGFPSSYAPPLPATPNGGSPFVVPAVSSFGQGSESAGNRPAGTSYGSARVPQPDEGIPASPYGSASSAFPPADRAPSPFPPANGSASSYPPPDAAGPSYPPLDGARSSYPPPDGARSPYPPADGSAAPFGSAASGGDGSRAGWGPAPAPRSPESDGPFGRPDSGLPQRSPAVAPGDPLPQRNPTAPPQLTEFNGFAAGNPGRGLAGEPPPALPSSEFESAGRPAGVSAFGDQRVRVPGATLSDLPDAPAPGRGGFPEAPDDGGSPSGGFPLRGGATFPTRRGDSGGFPLRSPVGLEGDAPAGDLPIRSQQTPFGAPEPSGFPSQFGSSAVHDAPHPYARASAPEQPAADDPFGADQPDSPFGASPFGRRAQSGSTSPFGGSQSDSDSPFGGPPSNDSLFGSTRAGSDSPFNGSGPDGGSPYGSAPPGNDSPFGSGPGGNPDTGSRSGNDRPRSGSPYGSPLPNSDSPYDSPQPESDSPFGNSQPGAGSPFNGGRPGGGSPYGSTPSGSDSPYGNAPSGSDSPFGNAAAVRPESGPPFGNAQVGGSENGSSFGVPDTFGVPDDGSSVRGAESASPYGAPASGSPFGGADEGSRFGSPDKGSRFGSPDASDDHSLYRRPDSPDGESPSFGRRYPQRVPGAALGAIGLPGSDPDSPSVLPGSPSASASPSPFGSASMGEFRNSSVPQPRDPAERSTPAVGSARPVTASASVPSASRVAPVDPSELPPPPAAPQARVYGRPAAEPAPADDEPAASESQALSNEPPSQSDSPFRPPSPFGRSPFEDRPDNGLRAPGGLGSPAFPAQSGPGQSVAGPSSPGPSGLGPSGPGPFGLGAPFPGTPGEGSGQNGLGGIGGPAYPGQPGGDQNDAPGFSSPAYPSRPNDAEPARASARASASARVAPPGARPAGSERPGGPSPFGEPTSDVARRGGPPEQYAEHTSDISGRGEQPYVPAPALPSFPPSSQPDIDRAPMGGLFPGPAGRATVTPPTPEETTSWPGVEASEPGRFDQFKPDAEAAPTPVKPETPHVRMLPVLLAVVVGAALLVGLAFGIVYLVAGGDNGGSSNAGFSVNTGACVKKSGTAAVKADCNEASTFQVVSIVDDKAKCGDPQQPYVLNPTKDGKTQVLCLKPNG